MLCIGHRGAMGYAPENTLISFRKALALGAPCVELDVYNVQGTLLVFHDANLERTTNGAGNLMDHDLAYLRSLVLEQNQQIPTLEEVLQLVQGEAGINIELKGPNTANAVIDFIGRQTDSDWALVSSFNLHWLHDVRQACPQVKLGVLIPEREFDLEDVDVEGIIRVLKPYSIHFPLNNITQARVARFQRQGLRVFVYTANCPEDIERMAALGVDGVFTDFPDRVPVSQEEKALHGWP